ncbi:MAG: hypothetical protein BWY50_01987 [Spirochaetes bacterium ADurb.Bin315]|nr:MAG: hypothetical protein BWY50_01987 [Spirochaetes bacterium ADurb.Bin315]
MDRYSDCDADAQRGIGKRSHESGQSFRKVVDGDRQSGEHSQPEEPMLGCLVDRFVDVSDLMRVLVGRDQPVDDGDQRDSSEEGDRCDPVALRLSERDAQRIPGLHENLDEGDVDHHPCGKSQRPGKELGIELLGKERQQAPDSGSKTGK